MILGSTIGVEEEGLYEDSRVLEKCTVDGMVGGCVCVALQLRFSQLRICFFSEGGEGGGGGGG